MNIIFGDSVKLIPDSYIVLELDTVRTDNDAPPFTAYCVVEKIPLHEFPLVEAHKKLHADVIIFFLVFLTLDSSPGLSIYKTASPYLC